MIVKEFWWSDSGGLENPLAPPREGENLERTETSLSKAVRDLTDILNYYGGSGVEVVCERACELRGDFTTDDCTTLLRHTRISVQYAAGSPAWQLNFRYISTDFEEMFIISYILELYHRANSIKVQHRIEF